MTVCGTKLVRFDEVVCMERTAGWKNGMIRSISWADGFQVSADCSPQARTGPECGTRQPFEVRGWTPGAQLSTWGVDSAINSELKNSSGVSAHPS